MSTLYDFYFQKQAPVLNTPILRYMKQNLRLPIYIEHNTDLLPQEVDLVRVDLVREVSWVLVLPTDQSTFAGWLVLTFIGYLCSYEFYYRKTLVIRGTLLLFGTCWYIWHHLLPISALKRSTCERSSGKLWYWEHAVILKYKKKRSAMRSTSG